ncbi:hypothetical protein RJ641_026994, partial [Dillenia turbinata]
MTLLLLIRVFAPHATDTALPQLLRKGLLLRRAGKHGTILLMGWECPFLQAIKFAVKVSPSLAERKIMNCLCSVFPALSVANKIGEGGFGPMY